MEHNDHQCLYISEDKGPVSSHPVTRGLWWSHQQPSSRLIILLFCICAGLTLVNIVITAASRGSRGHEEERSDQSLNGQESGKDGLPREISLPCKRIHSLLPDNETYNGACPDDWSQFWDSCYYLSNQAQTWMEAHSMCQRRKARLTVINTQEEQVFLTKFAMKIRIWIGLSEIDGEWKWVDGTPYSSTPKKWAPGQPDEYFGHGLGGGEDCVQFLNSGDWNDEHCSRPYRYICEKKAVQ